MVLLHTVKFCNTHYLFYYWSEVNLSCSSYIYFILILQQPRKQIECMSSFSFLFCLPPPHKGLSFTSLKYIMWPYRQIWSKIILKTLLLVILAINYIDLKIICLPACIVLCFSGLFYLLGRFGHSGNVGHIFLSVVQLLPSKVKIYLNKHTAHTTYLYIV